MSLPKLSNEAALLDGTAKGDETAFSELFHAYHGQLAEFVQLLTRDLDMTEEILQDVFTKIWLNREALPLVKKFDAYLFILCRNHTLNHIRKKAAERKKLEAYVRQVEDPVVEMDDVGDRPEAYELVERAIQLLPPRQQKVFMLRQQGYRNPEISRQMNLSIDSVKKYQHLALKFISEFVKAEVVISVILAVCCY